MRTTADRVDTFCTPDEIREILRLHIDAKYQFQSEAALAWKCSAPFVNAIMRGNRDPSPRMLLEIGYEKVKGFSWKPTNGKPALLANVKGALPEPQHSPIRILWIAGDMDDYHRVTERFRTSVRELIDEKFSNRIQAAKVWECSVGLVSHVLSGTKLPTDPMLSDLGLQRITGYRKLPSGHSKGKK